MGQIRGKFGGSIPIPGDTVTLNASDLLGQAAAEMTALRDELKTILDETTYIQLADESSTIRDSTEKVLSSVPTGIYVG